MTQLDSLNIIGAGGHSKVVRESIDSELYHNVIFLVQEKFSLSIQSVKNKELLVKSFEQALLLGPQAFICAIGSISARKALFLQAVECNWMPRTVKHKSALIASDCSIGSGTYVGARSIINPDSIIGENTIVNTAAIVEHDCLIGSHVNISPGAIICGSVVIGSQTLIGAGVTILPGITIEEKCIVGAGALVTSDVKAGSVVVGVPAKVI